MYQSAPNYATLFHMILRSNEKPPVPRRLSYSWLASQRSASRAAAQPVPAAVIAWR
jgi:hypothetical protein